jgi:hypothetical protein
VKETSPNHPSVTKTGGYPFPGDHFRANRKTMRNDWVKVGDSLGLFFVWGQRGGFSDLLSPHAFGRLNLYAL